MLHTRRLAELSDALEVQNARLEPYYVLAPIDGVVADLKWFSEGDWISAEQEMMRIIDISVYRLSMQSNKENFRYNMPVSIKLSNDEYIPGTIVSDPVLNHLKDNMLNFYIRIDTPIENIGRYSSRTFSVTGMGLTVEDTLQVPGSAVKNEETKRYVHILENGIVKKRYVKIGFNNTKELQIIYGISPGDQIIQN
jgi:multidrug efflux pump subunit AcrA (membrane-fusion protein)